MRVSTEGSTGSSRRGGSTREVLVEARCPPRLLAPSGLDPVPGRTHTGWMALPRFVRGSCRRAHPGAVPAPAVGLVGVTMDPLGFVAPNPAEAIKWGLLVL